MKEVGSQDVVSAIDDGLIQVGFVALPITTEIPYEFFIFHEEPLDVVLWPDHPLASQPSLTLSDIKDETFVFYPSGFSLNPYLRSAFQEIMAHPKIVCRSSNWDFLAQMVAGRLGISLMPHTICQRISPDLAVSVPLVQPHLYWTLALIWKSKGYLSHPSRTWVQSFKDYFKDANAAIQSAAAEHPYLSEE